MKIEQNISWSLQEYQILTPSLLYYRWILHYCVNRVALAFIITSYISWTWSFHGSSDVKECACVAGDQDSISESEKSPGEGNVYPLQYSCLENSMDRGA